MTATVHQSITWSHVQFPVRLSLLIKHPELGPEMAADSNHCMLDPFSLAMKKAHPQFTGEVFQEKLKVFALHQFTDISGVEARHASTRRNLVQRSCQTHVLDVADASAEYVFQQSRTSQRLFHNQGLKHSKPVRKQVTPSFVASLCMVLVSSARCDVFRGCLA